MIPEKGPCSVTRYGRYISLVTYLYFLSNLHLTFMAPSCYIQNCKKSLRLLYAPAMQISLRSHESRVEVLVVAISTSILRWYVIAWVLWYEGSMIIG
jgi:hypothetical protein